VENTVYIDPLAHRRGVGSLLTKQIIEGCTAQGYRQMIAVISGTEDCASIKMHRALGFKDAGRNRAVGYKHGRWIDTFNLQLALGDGDTSPPDMTLVS
jgi:phosphinothricin acetyltransferase